MTRRRTLVAPPRRAAARFADSPLDRPPTATLPTAHARSLSQRRPSFTPPQSSSSRIRHAPLPLRSLGPLLLPLLVLAIGACSGATPTPEVDPEGPLQLSLEVSPVDGDAPHEVRARAELSGELGPGDAVRFRCATAAFIMGNDTVQHVPPEQPCDDEVQRAYETTYTYEAAGTYPISVRLIARPVRPSRSIQVFVRGATPTPVSAGAASGPNIVIATPVTRTAEPPTQAATEASAPAATATRMHSATPEPVGPATRVAVDATPAIGVSVLPADLYFLSGEPARIARLPASGDPPEAVGPPDERSVSDYAVSSLGLVAVLAEGELAVLSPLGEARIVAADGASHPTWSRDGRALAYARNGVLHHFDVVTFKERSLATRGEPVAYSHDGAWLLARDPEGAPLLLQPDSSPIGRQPLPLDGAAYAGWLPGRNVLWLSGPGLRFVSVEDAITVAPVLDTDVATSPLFVRPDERALLLAERNGSSTLHLVDLTAPMLEAEVVGVPLVLPVDADFAWSPDGRWLAVAGPSRLIQFNPVTGLSSTLVEGPVRRPSWVLSGR